MKVYNMITKSLLVLGLSTSMTGCGVLAQSVAQNIVPSNTQQPVQVQSTQPQQSTNVEFAFTKAKQHPEQKLIELINQSQQTLDIAIYSLTYPDIVKAIKDAKSRGISVRILTDKSQSSGKTQQEALKILANAGIPVKINHHSGLMHLKVTIIDNQTATTGSFNYSKAASTTNDEVFVILRDKAIAEAFKSEFEKMWTNEKDFEPYTVK